MNPLWTMRLFIVISIAFGLGLTLFSGLIIYEMKKFSEVRISFLDVGQGDAILISEGSQQILIDGGPDGRVLLEEIGGLMPFWDRTVEAVIATHPDGDHIDGLVDLVQTYHVGQFIMTSVEKDTSTFTALMRNMRNRNIAVAEGERGMKISLPSGAHLEIIYPFVAGHVNMLAREPNNTSITAIFHVGQDKFFLGGDLHSDVEDLLPVDESITVLKAGHHGSGTSTSESFLKRTTPRDVIISAGKDNRYGHPKDTVLSRIQAMNINIYRTDTDGTIRYVCGAGCIVEL